jgi:hypothetical protein
MPTGEPPTPCCCPKVGLSAFAADSDLPIKSRPRHDEGLDGDDTEQLDGLTRFRIDDLPKDRDRGSKLDAVRLVFPAKKSCEPNETLSVYAGIA